jgi:hypothetical protein
MKHLTITLLAILLCAHSFAQDGTEKAHYKKSKKEYTGRPPVLYINTSTGINNNTGLVGVGIDVPVGQKLLLGAGAGISTWGDKIYIGGKYFLRPGHTGWAFGGGVTHNTGLTNFTDNLETVYGNTEQVTLNLNAQTNVFLAAYRYWSIGRKRINKFYLELGWSVPLTGDRFDQTDGDPISSNSTATMNLLSPGGIIVGAGFSFGVR